MGWWKLEPVCCGREGPWVEICSNGLPRFQRVNRDAVIHSELFNKLVLKHAALGRMLWELVLFEDIACFKTTLNEVIIQYIEHSFFIAFVVDYKIFTKFISVICAFHRVKWRYLGIVLDLARKRQQWLPNSFLWFCWYLAHWPEGIHDNGQDAKDWERGCQL